jgi:hypothetical protein
MEKDAVELARAAELAATRPPGGCEFHDLRPDAAGRERVEVWLDALAERRVRTVAREYQKVFRLGHHGSFRRRL